MNEINLKLIIQYTLAIAAQEEGYDEKDLGPIHFVKYVYLADMEYAKHNNGETFTGIEWKFHHFGPWSNAVHEAIEPALEEIHANKKQISSDYGDDDFVRWSLRTVDKNWLDKTGKELGITVKSALQDYVHKFKNDTGILLAFIYATLPILNAAPGEILDFSTVVKEKNVQQQSVQEAYVPYMQRLSNKKRKTLNSKMKELRESFQAKVAEQSSHYSTKQKCDDVFEEGVQWLDSLAGETLSEEGTTIQVDDSLWKSEARRGSL